VPRAGPALALLAALSGCGFEGLYGVSLPGGNNAPGGITVIAVFDDVLDLVPQSAVKVADVTVGTVRDVELTPDLQARVEMRIERDVDLPANAVAVVQQTSLLGEKFVELGPPARAATGRLADGAVIRTTTTYPDIEQVFGALSLVLNGGSLDRLQTIAFELSKAMAGREGAIKDLLDQLNRFVGGLDSQKSQIVRALDGLDRLAATLAKQRSTLATALDDLAPGLKVLADNRSQLTELLASLDRLGEVSTRVINASRANTAANLRDLQPILQRIQAAGDSLPRSFELLLDFPFPKNAAAGIPGDYTSLFVTLLLDGSTCNLLPLPTCPTAPVTAPQRRGSAGTVPAPSGGTPAPAAPGRQLPPLPRGLQQMLDDAPLTGLLVIFAGALQ
jgi:phospholipid/cholesterol/gamma-HCH transport system substrate-binding protein